MRRVNPGASPPSWIENGNAATARHLRRDAAEHANAARGGHGASRRAGVIASASRLNHASPWRKSLTQKTAIARAA